MVNRNVIGYSGPALALEWATFRSGFDIKTATLPGQLSPSRWLVPTELGAAPVPLTREIDDDVVNRFAAMTSDDDVRRFAHRFGFLWLDYAMTFNRTRISKRAERWLFENFRIANDVDLILDHAADMRTALALASNPARTPDDAASVAVTVGNALLDVGNLYVSLHSHSDGTLRQHFGPRSLLGGIWIRFANLIADQAGAIHICAKCSSPFVVASKARGNPRQWCSNACKQAQKRERSKHVDHK